jgi:hypothetical protein
MSSLFTIFSGSRRGGPRAAVWRRWRRFWRRVGGRRLWARSLRRLRRRQDRLARRQDRVEADYWDHLALVNRLAAIERGLERLDSGAGQPWQARNEVAAVVPPSQPPASRLVCSVVLSADEAPQQLGVACYAYHFVYQAFAGLLREQFGEHAVVKSVRDLEAAARAASTNGRPGIHLSFLPLHYMRVVPAVENAAFVFWEFPEVPNYDIAGNPRNNWPTVANELAAIFTASSFTQDALLNAGTRVPIHLVRVPIQEEFFSVAARQPAATVSVETPCFWFGGESDADDASAGTNETRQGQGFPGHYSPCLELRGTVYTSIFNPFDQRKDWPTMLSAFLAAFSDCPEAMLVLKLAASHRLARPALEQFARCYVAQAEKPRCRVAVTCEFLSDAQMLELARGTTFILNTSRAEGACLPLQNFLAAGRPAISPRHTALTEFIDAEVGFVVDSRREPTYFPFDTTQKITTSWQPVVEESLVEQLAASYLVAQSDTAKYRTLAANARRRMADFASYATVRRQFSEAAEQLQASR